MTKEEYKYYIEGVITGLEAYAWWKDGTQYVGTCGTTLESAIAKAKAGTLYNMIKREVFELHNPPPEPQEA